MNEQDRAAVIGALDRLTAAVEKQRTLVPLVLMVPNNITDEHGHRMMRFIAHELRKAGLMPEETQEETP